MQQRPHKRVALGVTVLLNVCAFDIINAFWGHHHGGALIASAVALVIAVGIFTSAQRL